MSVGGVTFPLEQQSKDPQSVVYSGQYDTEGVAHTKSGERQPVQINIQVSISLLIIVTGVFSTVLFFSPNTFILIVTGVSMVTFPL